MKEYFCLLITHNLLLVSFNLLLVPIIGFDMRKKMKFCGIKDTSQYCVKLLDQHRKIFDKVCRNFQPMTRTSLYIRSSAKLRIKM